MKKGVKIFIIIFVILIVILISIFYSLNKKKQCESLFTQINEDTALAIKCLSLCPMTSEIDIRSAEFREIFEPSCSFYCRNYIYSHQDNEEKLEDKCRKILDKLSYEENSFLKKMIECKDDDFNMHKTCLGKITENIDFKLERYPLYNLTIEKLDCRENETEIKLKLNEGVNGLETFIHLQGTTDYGPVIKRKSPNLGEFGVYIINHRQEGFSSNSNFSIVGVSLVIDNKTTDFLDIKFC